MADAHHSSRADFVRGASMQTANFARLEFPANDGGERADEIGDASVNQQSRRIDLEVLALEAKLFAIASDAGFIPFSAGTKIEMTIRNVKEAFHSPPLRALLEVRDRFEDASWRSCNEDLRQDCIGILSESCGCHISAPDVSGFGFFGESLQPREDQRPAKAVAFELIDVAGESAMREFHDHAVSV